MPMDLVEEGPWAQSDIFQEPTDPDMIEYLGRKRASFQNQVVNIAQGMSIGPALYLWTHRLTNADVISVVTTTRPFTSTVSMTTTATAAGGGLPVPSARRGAGGGGGGAILRGPPYDGGSLGGSKDKWNILPQSEDAGGGLMAVKGGKAFAELKKIRQEERLRVPLQQPVFNSPLEAGPASFGEASNKAYGRMSECLVAERDRFMELLGKEREDRVHLEAFACSLVQAAYRGHLLRRRWPEVESRQQVRLRVRKSLREFLKSIGAPFALGAVEKQQAEDRLRRAAACTIQASFRCFVARQTLGKRRMAAFLFKRRRAARTLQCWGRYLFAIRRLRYTRIRALATCRSKAALAIQRQYRRHLAARITNHRRRVVRSIAASTIQGQWRLRRTLDGIEEVTRARLFRSAAAMQRIARGYVARKKVGRQLTRVRALSRVRAMYTLQKFIRRAQARWRVERLRHRRRRGVCARAALHVQRACRGFVGRRRAAARKKAANLDIWRAAREGNATRVDALYYGQGLGGVIFDCRNKRDAEGNSLLAAVTGGVGPISLVRVVLKWGADVNSVNHRGESALRLAMSKRNVEVVDLLVNNPDIRLNEGRPGKSILHEAAALGLHHLAMQLVSKGLDVDGVDPENGWTPVHYACHNGRAELARLLTSRSGAETGIDLGGEDGAAPLHLAAAGGWEKCATNLLENNASPLVKNNKGQVPAVVAMLNGHESSAKTLLRAFSAAKTAPKRFRAIDAIAALAQASGVTQAPDSSPAGANGAENNGSPRNSSGPEGEGIARLADAALAAAAKASEAGAEAPLTGDKGPAPAPKSTREGGSSTAGEMDASAAAGEGGVSLAIGLAIDGIKVAAAAGGEKLAAPSLSGRDGGGDGGGGNGGGGGGTPGSPDGGEQQDDVGSQSSAAGEEEGGGGGASVASNASSRVSATSLTMLKRQASEAGIVVDLDASMLNDLVPHCWDDNDIRCAVSLAEKGEVWCLASLFALGLDPTCRHPDSGDTIGIAATRGGHRETLELCLESGVPFAAKNNKGRSALHAAVVRGDLEVAALLLVNPGLSGLEVDDLCDQDEDGRTPLHEMATRGEAPTVLLLATELDSEGASSSSAPGGALDSNGSGASAARRHGGGSPSDGDSRDTSSSSSDNEQSSVADSSSSDGHGGAAQSSSSSADTTASPSVGVDADAGVVRADSDGVKRTSIGSAGAAHRKSTLDAAGPDGQGGTFLPSLRSPLPLSTFAAPSLADTKELDGHSLRRSEQEADPGLRGGAPSGGRASADGEASAVLAVSVNSPSRRSVGGGGDSNNPSELGAGDEAGSSVSDTDSNSAAMNGGGGGSESTRTGGGEEEDNGWGGILEVNVRCSGSGNCPLHEAAASGSVGAVLSLLDLGADISIANSRGDTALHVVVGPEAPRDYDDEGRESLRSKLLSSVSSFASTTTPASAELSAMSSSTLMAPGAMSTSGSGSGGEAPTDATIVCDDEGRGPTTQVVTALLRRGADPERKDGRGRTAAMCAVLAGRTGALRELREAARLGPMKSKNREQQELSELGRVAIREGHVACLRVITDGCSQEEVLAWADEEGVPALALAVAHGQRECIDILLKGVSPIATCGGRGDGNTVLHVTAMTRGGVPVLKKLMSSSTYKGGTGEPFDLSWLEWRNSLGDTVLMTALRAGRHAAALLLLQAAAVPTAAAHTFRYAWVIAAALSVAELCPCPSCVLGRTAAERARLCSKTRPGDRSGASISSPSNAGSMAAHRSSVAFASRANSKVGFGAPKSTTRSTSRMN